MRQVLIDGTQTIQLSAKGDAIGGTVVLNQAEGQQFNRLYIPSGVTVIDNGATGELSVRGNIINQGSFLALSEMSGNSTVVTAKNIVNNHGGVVSSSVPIAGELNLGNLTNGVNLTLVGREGIYNAGEITGGGNPDSSIRLQTNNLTNTGTITAKTGSLNIDVHDIRSNVRIDNIGGTLNATAGDINIGTTNSEFTSLIDIWGGDYNSKNLNLNGANGVIEGVLGKVSGKMSTNARVAHVGAHSDVLVLGDTCITGDPTFWNTGDIVIEGDWWRHC